MLLKQRRKKSQSLKYIIYYKRRKVKNQWLTIYHKYWQKNRKLNPKKVEEEIIKIRAEISEIKTLERK